MTSGPSAAVTRLCFSPGLPRTLCEVTPNTLLQPLLPTPPTGFFTSYFLSFFLYFQPPGLVGTRTGRTDRTGSRREARWLDQEKRSKLLAAQLPCSTATGPQHTQSVPISLWLTHKESKFGSETEWQGSQGFQGAGNRARDTGSQQDLVQRSELLRLGKDVLIWKTLQSFLMVMQSYEWPHPITQYLPPSAELFSAYFSSIASPAYLFIFSQPLLFCRRILIHSLLS